MTELAIDVTGLSKKFGDRLVVDHIALKVKKSAIFGFLGANGSGKTTTIRMLCGLLTPSEGQGSCLGYNIRTQSAQIKQHIGYMPQKFSFYDGLTVHENLRFVADIFAIPQPQQAIAAMIKNLELRRFQDTKAIQLSGGWKQRLALACSFLHKPQLLFLDEPTAGVDPKARKDFWDYLHHIATDEGTTILITTHYMDEAEKCTDLAYIHQGKMLYSGLTKELLAYSQVQTYTMNCVTDTQSAVMLQMHRAYPDLLVTIVNNELRISSADHTLLNNWRQSTQHLPVKAVTPSFEEVFIGLMR